MTYGSSNAREAIHKSVLTALADPTRQFMLEQLRVQPLAVGELAQHLTVSRPAVSQHLKALKNAHLVREHRDGTRHYYSLDPTGFAALRMYVDSMWQDALQSFAAYVAEQKGVPPFAAASKKGKTPPVR